MKKNFVLRVMLALMTTFAIVDKVAADAAADQVIAQNLLNEITAASEMVVTDQTSFNAKANAFKAIAGRGVETLGTLSTTSTPISLSTIWTTFFQKLLHFYFYTAASNDVTYALGAGSSIYDAMYAASNGLLKSTGLYPYKSTLDDYLAIMRAWEALTSQQQEALRTCTLTTPMIVSKHVYLRQVDSDGRIALVLLASIAAADVITVTDQASFDAKVSALASLAKSSIGVLAGVTNTTQIYFIKPVTATTVTNIAVLKTTLVTAIQTNFKKALDSLVSVATASGSTYTLEQLTSLKTLLENAQTSALLSTADQAAVGTQATTIQNLIGAAKAAATAAAAAAALAAAQAAADAAWNALSDSDKKAITASGKEADYKSGVLIASYGVSTLEAQRAKILGDVLLAALSETERTTIDNPDYSDLRAEYLVPGKTAAERSTILFALLPGQDRNNLDANKTQYDAYIAATTYQGRADAVAQAAKDAQAAAAAAAQAEVDAAFADKIKAAAAKTGADQLNDLDQILTDAAGKTLSKEIQNAFATLLTNVINNNLSSADSATLTRIQNIATATTAEAFPLLAQTQKDYVTTTLLPSIQSKITAAATPVLAPVVTETPAVAPASTPVLAPVVTEAPAPATGTSSSTGTTTGTSTGAAAPAATETPAPAAAPAPAPAPATTETPAAAPAATSPAAPAVAVAPAVAAAPRMSQLQQLQNQLKKVQDQLKTATGTERASLIKYRNDLIAQIRMQQGAARGLTKGVAQAPGKTIAKAPVVTGARRALAPTERAAGRRTTKASAPATRTTPASGIKKALHKKTASS